MSKAARFCAFALLLLLPSFSGGTFASRIASYLTGVQNTLRRMTRILPSALADNGFAVFVGATMR